MKRKVLRIAAAVGVLAVLCIALTACMGPVAVNQDPVANFTTEQVDGTLTILFDGRSSIDPDGDITFWKYYFGDGGTGNGSTATHTYESAGVYHALLRVTDNDGARNEVTLDVIVAPVPVEPDPVEPDPDDSCLVYPEAYLYWLPAGTAQVDAKKTFIGKRSVGSIDYAWWDFGDGTLLEGPWTKWVEFPPGEFIEIPGMSVVEHMYVQTGSYMVSLTVLDTNGLPDSIARVIKVE